jgi:hypothetical protein
MEEYIKHTTTFAKNIKVTGQIDNTFWKGVI